MANTLPTIQNLNTQWNVPDANTILIDLIKASGLLQTGLVLPSNLGNRHRYKYHNTLPAAAFRSLGQGIAPSALNHNWAMIDLWDLASLAQEDKQIIDSYPGGKDGWIIENMAAYLESMGQTAAAQVFYGTLPTSSLGATNSTLGFKGLYQYATDFGQVHDCGGSASTGTTSIYAVRWEKDNGVSIRVGGNTKENKELVQVQEIPPSLVVTDTTLNTQLLVNSWWLNALFTLVVPSKKTVSVLHSVSADTDCAPLASEMDAMLNEVTASSGRVVIYANTLGKSLIANLKEAKLSMYRAEMDYDRMLESYAGVPIALDENILSNETDAVFGR